MSVMDMPERLPAPAQGFGESLMALIADEKIPAEKLMILLQMRRELLEQQAVESFKMAYVDMTAEMPQVSKDGWVDLGGNSGYGYARWEDMDTAIRPIIVKYGFALTFREEIQNGQMVLVGELMHRDGHSLIARRLVKPDRGRGRNDAQAEGSGLSYAKRYLAEELLNIVRKGVDNDAIDQPEAPISELEVAALEKLLKETGTDIPKFLAMFVDGVDRLEDIPPRSYARLRRMVEDKKSRSK